MRSGRVAAALAVLLAAAACSGASGGAAAPAPAPKPPARAALVRAAHLDPCPRTVSAPARGGLPDITLPCLGGGPPVHLAGLRGRPTVVNVWGSWCVECQKETPFLTRAYDELAPRIRVLGVDDEDDPDSALSFAAHVRPAMHYPSVVDDDKRLLVGLHGPFGVPQTIFVDASGTVVGRTVRAYATQRELDADIARYLGVRRG